jgi:acyl dehydratase
VGKPLGPSDWEEVTQERIQLFAEATGDHQWIHVDPERARRESPFGAPVAHGFLTLSLVPTLLARILRVEGADTIFNTGVERMRLSTPVPAGSRVRMRAEIKHARDMPRGGVHATLALEIEVEGVAKPACRGEVTLVYPPPA